MLFEKSCFLHFCYNSDLNGLNTPQHWLLQQQLLGVFGLNL